MSEPLLEVEDLTIRYATEEGAVTAVSDASFSIREGEYFGLVGESGCGKSTLVKAVLRGLDDNGSIVSGTIRYRGEEIQAYPEQRINREIRWKEISWIPQSSMNSLDPLRRISTQAVELANVHSDLTQEEALSKFADMFEVVGLPEERITDYPSQFSGGMKQRAIIALALFLEPDLVIADEPTTALDVIMQDQVFKYLDEVKERTDTSVLLITHDISVVFESCDRLAIMHGGQIAETGTTADIYDTPHHPYSILLQGAFPDVRHPRRELVTIEGRPPKVLGDVDYCTFVDRCPWAVDECTQQAPPLERVGDGSDGHRAACVRRDEVLDLHRSEGDDARTAPTSR